MAYLEERGADMLINQLKQRVRQCSDTQVRMAHVLWLGKQNKKGQSVIEGESVRLRT